MTRAELLTALIQLASQVDATDDAFNVVLDASIKLRRLMKFPAVVVPANQLPLELPQA